MEYLAPEATEIAEKESSSTFNIAAAEIERKRAFNEMRRFLRRAKFSNAKCSNDQFQSAVNIYTSKKKQNENLVYRKLFNRQ